MAAAKPATSQHSVTVGVSDLTLKTITDEAAAQKTPASATINTGGFFAPATENQYNYSLTFTWVE